VGACAGGAAGVGEGGADADLPMTGSGCVAGNAGGRERWGTGSRSAGTSTFPLCTKTFAWGFATMTRGGGGTTRPDWVDKSATGSEAGFGGTGIGGGAATGGAGVEGGRTATF